MSDFSGFPFFWFDSGREISDSVIALSVLYRDLKRYSFLDVLTAFIRRVGIIMEEKSVKVIL